MDDRNSPFPPVSISGLSLDPAMPVLAFINVTPEAAKEASEAVNGLSSAIRDHGSSVGNGLTALSSGIQSHGSSVGYGLTALGLGFGIGLSAIGLGLALSRSSLGIRSLAALRGKQL